MNTVKLVLLVVLIAIVATVLTACDTGSGGKLPAPAARNATPTPAKVGIVPALDPMCESTGMACRPADWGALVK